MSRVFIVHRWSGNPESDWYSWLKGELEILGYEVFVPEMPNSDEPEIDAWVGKLRESVGSSGISESDYFVGHSIGCQTILRYLESLDLGMAGGVVLVAPWMHLNESSIAEEPGSLEIAKPWIETEIDFSNARKRVKRVSCIFSDNDPYVPLSDKDIFREMLGAEVRVLHDRGHFSQDDGCEKLPEALEEFEKLGKN